MAAKNTACTACGAIKASDDFSGHNKVCNTCRGEKNVKNANGSLERYLQIRLSALRQRHKKYAGTPVTLAVLLDIYKKQNGMCAITGLPMHYTTKESDLSVSPDRIDNSQGYIEGNVRLVCARANLMQSVLDDTHLLWWCRAVVNHLGN